ncbi:MAG: putative bifunctional diguanylate cyclase/phosphodiesterase [Cellulosilyticaceae bacterium]
MSMLLFWIVTSILMTIVLGFYVYQNDKLVNCRKNLVTCRIVDATSLLPNRSALENDLGKAAKEGKAQGMIILNIDEFKLVNDLVGYDEGNKLLLHISQRITSCIQENERLYHFGGDMFAIHLKHTNDKQWIEKLILQLFETLEAPIMLGETRFFTSFCAGIALYPIDTRDFKELVRLAELSMYVAKRQGIRHYEFFTQQLLDEVAQQSIIERELRYGLEHEEFLIFYQPKVIVPQRKISGYEALLRWHNHLLGQVSPDLFIRIAEKTGLIIPLGRWVFYESCMAIKRINATSEYPMTMAINVSIIEVLQEKFVPQVLGIIKYLEIPPNWIEIELTESVFLENKSMIVTKLMTLSKQGISIAIDDFGKEYSALGYLITLPINTIKIDKVFIDTIGTQQEWIVPTLIDICHKMRCVVVSEGVETQEQLEFLIEAKCDKVQGYIFSKPLKEEELLGLHFEL